MNKFSLPVIVATVGLASLSLAACGGSGGSTPRVTGSPSSGSGTSPIAGSSASASPAPQKPVPAAYDNTKGWVIPQRSTDGELADPVFAPDAGLVLVLSNPADKPVASIVAYDAKSGAVRWSSKPVALPQPGTTTVDPRIVVTRKAGKEYAVLARTGVASADGVSKGGEVTQLAVFDASSSGDQIAPLRDVTVPGFATDGYSPLRDGGTVAVLADQEGGATVDVTTGQVTSYDSQNALLKGSGPCTEIHCAAHAKLVGQTPVGPLVLGDGAFWSTGWTSKSAVPSAGYAARGTQHLQAYGTPGGEVLAVWPKDGVDQAVWAVHDGRTGQVLATVQCTVPAAVTVAEDGRYLIAGPVVFDLQAKQGHCFTATDARQAIGVSAVDPDGTAYGQADGGTAASVALATDQAGPLPAGTLAPDLIGDGVALFRMATVGPILVYPHR